MLTELRRTYPPDSTHWIVDSIQASNQWPLSRRSVLDTIQWMPSVAHREKAISINRNYGQQPGHTTRPSYTINTYSYKTILVSILERLPEFIGLKSCGLLSESSISFACSFGAVLRQVRESLEVNSFRPASSWTVQNFGLRPDALSRGSL